MVLDRRGTGRNHPPHSWKGGDCVPRIRIVRLEDGSAQIAVLANNASELPSRLIQVGPKGNKKEAARQAVHEWANQHGDQPGG